MTSRNINKNLYGYLFLIPFFLVFIAFSLYPIINTFYLAFTNTQLLSGFEGEWVGLVNFKRLFETSLFVTSVKNTFTIWIISFIPQITFAMFLAVLFNNQRLKLRGVGIYKAIYFLPNLIMAVTVASLFSSLLSLYGPVNQFLVSNGFLDSSIDYLKSASYTRFTVEFIQFWMWFGQTTIILYAGMTAISPTYYEAAMVDGATQTTMFRNITLPLLKPIMVYTLVTSLVGGLQMFDIPFLITNGKGDPNGSVMTMNVLMNMKRTSPAGDIGAAASVSVMIFIISSILAFAVYKLLSDKED